MHTRTIGRLGAAAVLAVGLVAASAVPASAAPHTVAIEASSQIDIGGTSTHFGGHATTNVCSPNSTPPTTIPADFDSTGGGTFGASSTGYGDFTVGTTTMKTRLVITGGTVTFTHTTVTITMSVRAEFRSCNSQTLLCQTNVLNVVLTGSNSTTPSSGPLHPTASHRVTVGGNVHVTVPFTCNFILSAALHSQTANVSLNIHVVT